MPARRPKIGKSKTIKLTLTDEMWDWFNFYCSEMKPSSGVREIIENYYIITQVRADRVDQLNELKRG